MWTSALFPLILLGAISLLSCKESLLGWRAEPAIYRTQLKGRQAFNLYSSPLSQVFFSRNLENCLSHSAMNQNLDPLLVVTLVSCSVLFDFGVGYGGVGVWRSGLCILLLNEIRVLIVKIGGVNLWSAVYCAFFWLWDIVQSTFCPQLLGKGWDACFWARVVSFLSIKLGLRVETFLHPIDTCLKSGHYTEFMYWTFFFFKSFWCWALY